MADPITVLGAVGSVVGIAGFGLQLAQFLDGFIEELMSANESLNDVRFGIYAINDALVEVQKLLEKERKHVVGRGHKARLFSDEGLVKVQSTAEQCLKVFWKIEDTIQNKDYPSNLHRRLSEFYAAIEANNEPPKLNLNTKKLSKRQSFMWSFRTRRKLESYKVQLQQLQTTLCLLFHVITLGLNYKKPVPDFNKTIFSEQYIRFVVGQLGYQDNGMYPPPPYPVPPRQPWVNEYDYELHAGIQYGGMKERRKSIKHPRIPHAPKPPGRRRSESESPPRGRARRRHTYHAMPQREDARAQSSPPGDTRKRNSENKQSSPDDKLPPDKESDTAAQLISDKLDAAKQYIAKAKPAKTKTCEPENGEAAAAPPLNAKAATAPQNPKPSGSNMVTETLSTVALADSPLETFIRPNIQNPTKRPSIYKRPFVTDQASERSSQETIKQSEKPKTESANEEVKLDDATGDARFWSTAKTKEKSGKKTDSELTENKPKIEEHVPADEWGAFKSAKNKKNETIGGFNAWESSRNSGLANNWDFPVTTPNTTVSAGDKKDIEIDENHWSANRGDPKKKKKTGLSFDGLAEIEKEQASPVEEKKDEDLDIAFVSDSQSISMFGNISASPMQLPEPDSESTTIPVSFLNTRNQSPFQLGDIVAAMEHIQSSNSNRQLVQHNPADSLARNKVAPAENNAGSAEQPLAPTNFLLLRRIDKSSMPKATNMQRKAKPFVSTPTLDTPESDPESSVHVSIRAQENYFNTYNTQLSGLPPQIEVLKSPERFSLPQPDELAPPNGTMSMRLASDTEALLATHENTIELEINTESYQPHETWSLDTAREPLTTTSLVGLSPDVQRPKAKETTRSEATLTQPLTENFDPNTLPHSSTSSPTPKASQNIIADDVSVKNKTSELDLSTKSRNSPAAVLPLSFIATSETLQKSTLDPSHGDLSTRVLNRPSQEIVGVRPVPTDDIREVATLPQTSDVIDNSSNVVSQPKQQIHITLSGLPAWERPVTFETSPWVDTVFAPAWTDTSALSNFENLTLTTLENESTTSISSSRLKKRDLVIETLKRMCRRDFVTEDDLETMYPGVGCFITAFTIKGEIYHQIPYAGQFSLRKTHLYSSSPKWWKDFAFLSPEEMTSLSYILAKTEDYARSLVLLKWYRRERLKFWSTKQRVLVAIIYNEPLVAISIDTEGFKHISGSTSMAPASSIVGPDENISILEGEPPSGAVAQDAPVTMGSPPAQNTKIDFTKADSARRVVSYTAFTIRVFDPHNLHGDSTLIQPTIVEEGFSLVDIVQRIRELNRESPSLIRKKLGLLDVQQDQISKVLDRLSAKEQNSEYVWNLLQLEEVEGPSKGLRVVTIYLCRASLATVAGNFVPPSHEAVPGIPSALEKKMYDDKQEETIPATKIDEKEEPTRTKEDLPTTAGVRENPIVATAPSRVNFEQDSGRQQRRNFRGSDRRRNNSTEESSGLSIYSDESNTSGQGNERRKETRKTRGKKASRKRHQNREAEKEKVAPDDPQSPWGHSYAPYYNGGPNFSPYVYPAAISSPYGMSYPSIRTGPYSSPNPMAAYPGTNPLYGYGPDQTLEYGNPFSPYPPEYNPPASSYYTPPPGAGYLRSMPPQTSATPRASKAQRPPASAQTPGNDSEREAETRPERIRRASERKATIRPSMSRQQPLHLRSGADNPTSSYSVNPPPSTRPKSYYGQQALPPISYGGAQTQSSYSRYGATPSAPPISQSAYAMPPPPSSYPYPPRRTPMPYPEYFDGRSFNPFAPLIEDERNNTDDIVQKLLLDWTPAGEELKEKREKEKEKETEEDGTDQDITTTDQESSDYLYGAHWRSKYKDDDSDNAPGPSTARPKSAYAYEVEEPGSTSHTVGDGKMRQAKSYQGDVGRLSMPLTAETLRRQHARHAVSVHSTKSSSSREDTTSKRWDNAKRVESEKSSYKSTKAEVSKKERPQDMHRRGSEVKPKDKGKERLKIESRVDDGSSSGRSRGSNFRPASITSVD